MVISVLTYLEEAAGRCPDKVALTDERGKITYAQLLRRAQCSGSYLLRKLGGRTGYPVAVLVDRSIDSLVECLAVVYSGNFYVPIGVEQPPRRVDAIIDAVRPAILLLPRACNGILRALTLAIDAAYFEDALAAPVTHSVLRSVRDTVIDQDPLYAVLTSGPDGVPRAVAVSHRSVANLIESFVDIFGLTERDAFANQAGFDSDISVKDIFLTLRLGARMDILPRALFEDGRALFARLNEQRLSVAIWPVSVLRALHGMRALDESAPLYLKKIMFSGESMPPSTLTYWRARLSGAMFVNLYGAAEVTCNCTYYIVDRPFFADETVPIGVPFPNTEILLLNEDGRRVALGEKGEICVRGAALALGYYNNADDTARAFWQNPLNAHYPDPIYRTGDMGMFNERGELVFVSRRDLQVKHKGQRVELGEIESRAGALPFIGAVCCLFDRDSGEIWLFYQADEACDARVSDALKQELPGAMLPDRLLCVRRMPRGRGGKIDRAFLRERYMRG